MTRLLPLLLVGCTPAEERSGAAVVMAVGSLDPVTNIEVWVGEVGETSVTSWRDEPFDVPRENFVQGAADFAPLLLRVNLERSGNYVIRLVGRGGVGVLEFTGCYNVEGTLEDDFVLLGRISGNDEDGDDSPDDPDAYCDMLTGEGAPCPVAGEPGSCPPAFGFDCNPDLARIHPLANDVCGNGEDEDCYAGDAPCVDCDDPANDDLPECSGDCGVCNPPMGCCGPDCVDLTTDDANCGSCGTSCVGDRSDGCSDGVCVCGASDSQCGSSSTCVAGACECEAGLGDCDDNPDNGCETDLNFDSDHCGNCETTCKTSCIDAVCEA